MASRAPGSGTVTVEDGGVRGGTGSAAGKVLVQAGRILAPGSAPLRLNGGVELQDGAGLEFRLGATSDLITSNETLLVGEDIHLTVTPQAGFEEGLYTLISFTGPLTDNSHDFSGWTVSGMNGYVGEFVFNGSSLDLLVTAVPKPGSRTLVLAGLAELVW